MKKIMMLAALWGSSLWAQEKNGSQGGYLDLLINKIGVTCPLEKTLGTAVA